MELEMQEGAAAEKLPITESCPTEASVNVLADSSSNVQNSSDKCKKRGAANIIEQKTRDRPNEELECPQKRVCIVNVDDISSIADKDGGLQDTVAVEKFIHLMQNSQASTQRSMLLGVLVATLKEECLHHFVELGGVTILDEWLQDCRKAAKSGDSKDVDRAMDEVMLAILQALEKLPVYLETLKECGIGKSVNHLKNRKNAEIQKKARKLVDIWKRRVEFEMKQNSPSSGTSDNSHKGDSMASSTIATPIKSEDESNRITTAGRESFSSTTVNFSASPNLSLVEINEKASSSFEKDGNKNNVHPCSSITSVSVASPNRETEDNNTTDGIPLVCKNDVCSQSDAQNYDGKGTRSGGNLNKHNQNGSAVVINVKERTNEYRKKLRSSSYRTPPSSTNSHLSDDFNHEMPATNAADMKSMISKEKNAIKDVKMGSELEQLTNTTEQENVLQSSSSTRIRDGSVEDCKHQKGGGMESVKGTPFSSMSYYTDGKSLALLNSTGMTVGDNDKGKDNDEKSKEMHQQVDIIQEKVHLSSEGKQSLSYHNSTKEIKDDNCGLKFDKTYILEKSPTQKSQALEMQLSTTGEIDPEHSGPQVGDMTMASANDTESLDEAAYSKDSSQFLPIKRKDVRIGICEAQISSNKSCQHSLDHAENILKSTGMSAAISSDGVISNLCHTFDLNEGFKEAECSMSFTETSDSLLTAGASGSTLNIPVAPLNNRVLAPTTDGRNNGSDGRKGSADTSGFQASIENQTSASQVRNVKNFDLNVVDQDFEECQNITPGKRLQSGLDLNSPGDYMEEDISVSGIPVQVSSVKVQKTSAKSILVFDLNEGPDPDDAHQEQALCTSDSCTSAVSLSKSSMPFGDPPLYSSPCPTFSLPTPNMSSRLETPDMRTVAQHNINSLYSSSALIPPPLPSMMYPHMAPFYGCTPMQFPATFSYNSLPQALDASFMDPKYGAVLVQPSQATMSIASNLRAPYTLNLPAGAYNTSNFYAWEKQDKNMYNSFDSAIVNYNGTNAREQLVNLESHAVPLEGQMCLFQQAPVSAASSKRKDLDFTGLRRSMGH